MIARTVRVLGQQIASDTSMRSYLTNILTATVPMFIIKFRGVLVIPIVVRAMGLDQYGIWVQLIVITHVLALIAGLGLHTALIRYYPECATAEERRRLIATALGIATLGAALMVAMCWAFAAELAAWLFEDAAQANLIRLSVLLTPLAAWNLLLLTIFRAQNRIKQYVFFKSLVGIVDLLVVVAMVLAFQSLPALILGGLVSLLAINSYLAVNHVRTSGLLPLPALSWGETKRYLRYALPVLPTQFSDELAARGDRLLVGFFLGPAAVGAYAVIYALASLATFLQTPVVEVLFPKLAQLRATNQHSLALRYMRLTIGGLVALGLATLALLIALRSSLWQLLAGHEAALIDNATLAGLLLSAGLGVLMFALARVLILNLFVGDRTLEVPLLYGLAAAVNIVANLALIPPLGLLGATLATLLAYLCMLLATLWVLGRKRLI
jgi:O-antigen/teichoic acid export membrane protein